MKKVLHTDHAPAAIGPYSQAIQAGPFVFCSGQIALSADKNVAIPADVKSQTVQVMKNVEAVLHGAGLKFENVVKTTIFLTDFFRNHRLLIHLDRCRCQKYVHDPHVLLMYAPVTLKIFPGS